MRFRKSAVMSLSMIIIICTVMTACMNRNNADGNSSKPTESMNADASKEPAKTDEPKASVKNMKLVLWNTAYPTIDENDKTKKKEDFYIFQAIKRFESVHPGVNVEVQDVPAGDELFTKFQTASVAKNGPDLTVFWSGNYMMRFKQFLEPMNNYFSAEEKDRIVGWDAATEGFQKDGGTIYGVPFGTDGTFGLYYNKKILQQAGIDPEKDRPKNIDQFYVMLEKIKTATGVTPIGLKSPDNFWQIPSYWFAQQVTSAGLSDIVDGKKNFNDPSFIKVAEAWHQLYARKLVFVGDSDQASQQFAKGKVAMIPGGNGITNARKLIGDDLGIMKVPDFSEDVKIHDGGVGGVGAAMVVTNYSKNKKETVDLIKFLMSREEQIAKIKAGEGNITNVKDVDIKEYIQDPLLITMQQWSNEPSTIFWPDNVYPAELTAEMATLESVVMTGKLSPEDFAKRIDKKRDELLATQK
jgi:raffinose/stachyose/melibiose transport system substrate-binding protein